MQQRKILFIDRDGTLIVEPPDKQVDSIAKLQLMPGVINALATLSEAGYAFVMVTNQDGLGKATFPEADFKPAQDLLLRILGSQGIQFEAVRICVHMADENCFCRKPQVGMVMDYVTSQSIDKSQSYVIGDRITDLEFASNLDIKGLQIGSDAVKDWSAVVKSILNQSRQATILRQTAETEVTITVLLDDPNERVISTGIAFFDHMLDQLAKHGNFGLIAKVNGDIAVDGHHTVEDTALVLGQALQKALVDKRGIGRYGFVLPMDEAIVDVSIDVCGRPYFVFEGQFSREKVGGLATELVPHFFQSFSQALGAALHMRVKGENAHHMVEALFKGLGRCLRQAVKRSDNAIPSTKGVL
jgi:imidazoleglycerol-phosphate dehydratase/histidinol-phosphatase